MEEPAGLLEAEEAEERLVWRLSSPARQVRCLSASNRGSGDNRQHLLSEPNYLLSTEEEEEGTGGPSHRFRLHQHRWPGAASGVIGHVTRASLPFRWKPAGPGHFRPGKAGRLWFLPGPPAAAHQRAGNRWNPDL